MRARVVAVVIMVVGAVSWGGAANALAPVTRISGADRFATAAQVSAQTFAPGVQVAYVATAANYPDALAGGAAAAKSGGPVVLVAATSVPSASGAELDRLNPGRIVVLGGTTAVSDSVLTSLQQYTAGTVTRLSGADRFATAAAVSAATFGQGVPIAYLATGSNFPDALSGGAAAGAQGGPVLLTSPEGIPASTASELDRLNPGSIVILGGHSAVSATVESQAASYSPSVVRKAGADRYATSVALSAYVFAPGVAKVFLATGENFPDALAGSPAAGIAHSPILLVRGTCIPPEVNAEITRLNPTAIVVLGGEAAVSSAVASGQVCTPPPAAPFTFGEGTYTVGSQLPPGTYRTRSDDAGCYWERLSNFSGNDDIIDNSFSNFHTVVTIRSSDVGFKTSGCAQWTNDLSALTVSRLNPFGQGVWIVNTDIEPGTWTAPGGSSCYWERMANFADENSILANDFDTVNPVVTISPTDAGFDTTNCGTWTRV